MKRSFFASLAMLTLALPCTSLQADDTTTITFDDGPEGWVGPAGPGGTTVIETSGGNPGNFMRTVFNNFGITSLTPQTQRSSAITPSLSRSPSRSMSGLSFSTSSAKIPPAPGSLISEISIPPKVPSPGQASFLSLMIFHKSKTLNGQPFRSPSIPTQSNSQTAGVDLERRTQSPSSRFCPKG